MNGAELISEKATIESLAEVGGSMRVCYVQEAHAFLKEASFLAGPPGKNHRHEFFPEFWLLWCIITWQLTEVLNDLPFLFVAKSKSTLYFLNLWYMYL